MIDRPFNNAKIVILLALCGGQLFDCGIARASDAKMQVDALLQRAVFLFQHQQVRDSIQVASMALNLDPGNAGAFMLRGEAHAAMEEPKYAVEDLEMALKLSPGSCNETVYTDCARSYCQLHQFQKALNLFNTAIQKFPPKKGKGNGDVASLYRDRASLYMLLHQEGKANEDINKAIQLSPTRPNYMARATFWKEKHEYQKAIDDITKAMQSFLTNHSAYDPEYLRIMQLRVELYDMTGQGALAKRDRELMRKEAKTVEDDLR